MVNVCIVCRTSRKPAFRFPKQPERLAKWLDFAYITKDQLKSHTVLCYAHFTKDCFFHQMSRSTLLITSVPTLHRDGIDVVHPNYKEELLLPNYWSVTIDEPEENPVILLEEETTVNASSTICRLCSNDLDLDKECYSIFEPVEITLAEKINFCLPINVTENDILPQHICRQCKDNLDACYLFARKVYDTSTTLINRIEEKGLQLILQCNSNVVPKETSGNSEVDLLLSIINEPSDPVKVPVIREDPPENTVHCPVETSETLKTQIHFWEKTSEHSATPLPSPTDAIDIPETKADPPQKAVDCPVETNGNIKSQILFCEVAPKCSITPLPSPTVNDETSDDEDACASKTLVSKIKRNFRKNILLARKQQSTVQTNEQCMTVLLCNLCLEIIEDKTHFSLHNDDTAEEELHSVSEIFKCEYCHKNFISIVKLLTHKNRHHSKKFLECTVCTKTTFCDIERCFQHFVECHQTDFDKSLQPLIRYPCTICSERFKTANELVIHNATHISAVPETVDHLSKPKKIRILQDVEVLPNNSEVIVQSKCHISDLYFRMVENVPPDDSEIIAINKCHICDLAFPLVENLNIHLNVHKKA